LAITRATASSVIQGLPKSKSTLAGNLPILSGSYESIATVTVGSGGQSPVSFTSIPSTYTHLQVRCIVRSAHNSGGDFLNLKVNSDTTGSNYARHLIYADGGGSATGASSTGSTITNLGQITAGTSTSGIFGTFVIDILDYKNTNKYKTIRSTGGTDQSGSGEVDFNSILWMNTAAISSIQFTTYNSSNIAQFSTFALYGIRG